jgi:tRNA threonylcarbamoyladenosine biosynthesis protein TsaB
MSASISTAATLGLDTATDDVAVAVIRGDEVVEERRVGPDPGQRPRHATALLGAVEATVAAAGGWGAIGLIGVGAGPGLFTGLRVGVATARALAQGLPRPIAAVGSLDALARGVRTCPEARGRSLLAAFDARRGEVFAALYATDGRAAWGPIVAGPDELPSRLQGIGEPPLAAGSGSLRFRAELEAAGAEVLPDAEPEHRIAARHVCALAAEAGPADLATIEPIYLRRPDAELWRERQRGHRPLE